MSRPHVDMAETPDDAAAAEAAAWLVRLQQTPREDGAEAAFRTWLVQGDPQVAAFSRATDVWEALGGVAPAFAAKARRREAQRRVQIRGAVAVVCVMIAGGVGWNALHPTYKTGIGEQQAVRLADGTSVTLNTATTVQVSYSRGERHVRLKKGEAFFDVARDTARPFIVEAGSKEVRALGTSFTVRRGADDIEVTLLSGIVDVTLPDASHGADHGRAPAPVTLSPGQRLRSPVSGPYRLDRPPLESITAWRHGEMLLEQTPLVEAVAEMNRYNKRPIILETPPSTDVRLSGVLKTGDSRGFARTVSSLYGLELEERKDGFMLRGRVQPR